MGGEITPHTEETKVAKSSEQMCDVDKLVAHKYSEFSVRRPGEKRDIYITGVLALSDKVVVCDFDNRILKIVLKLFDQSGELLSSLSQQPPVFGITEIGNRRFATVGKEGKLRFWTLEEKNIIREKDPYKIHRIVHDVHYNGTYYAMLHSGTETAITLLDTQGRQVRKIVIEEAFGKKIKLTWVIHMDSETHHIYVTCMYDDSGVLCVSVEGEPLWFTPMSGWLWGITEIDGALCVVNGFDRCLYLISKTGQHIKTLLDDKELVDRPLFISYSKLTRKLVVTFVDKDSFRTMDTVFVYYVTTNQEECE